MQESHQTAPFAYESLDEQTRAFVQSKADETHGLLRRTSQCVIQIGQNLLAVKERLPHGRFTPWLQAEFEMSRRTAFNFMQVAEKFGSKSANFALLPISVLYELAAPSTPDSVLQQIENQEISPTLEAIRTAKEEARLAKEAEARAHAEAEHTQQQYTLLNQEIALLQAQIVDLSAQHMLPREKEAEKFVIPPETTAQLEALQEKVAHLTQQREELLQQQKDLIQRVDELSQEAIAAAARQREPEEERRIRSNWYRLSRDFHVCVTRIQAQWPSPLDTLAFEAEDWNRVAELRLHAQRLLEACERLTAQRIVESVSQS